MTTPEPATAARENSSVAAFRRAQQRVLARYVVDAASVFVDVPAIGGRAHVLVAGDGPPLVMVIGATTPAVLWAPLMALLPGRTIYAMDLPGFGLTDAVDYRPDSYRRTAVGFLADVLDGLGVGRCQYVTHSMGSLWSLWLAREQARVEAQVMIACPAFFLGTTAPLPMRLASIPWLGRRLVTLQKPSKKQVDTTIAMVGENPSGLDEIRDVLLACERLPGHADSMLGMMRSVMSWTRARPEVVVEPEQLREISHPVQLIWGENDPFGTVVEGRCIADLTTGARFSALPGGHAPWFHHAERVATITQQFLADHPGPA